MNPFSSENCSFCTLNNELQLNTYLYLHWEVFWKWSSYRISTWRFTHLMYGLPCDRFFFLPHVIYSKALWKINWLCNNNSANPYPSCCHAKHAMVNNFKMKTHIFEMLISILFFSCWQVFCNVIIWFFCRTTFWSRKLPRRACINKKICALFKSWLVGENPSQDLFS